MRALLLLLAACSGPPLPEPFVVSDLRVISMVADPPEVRPGETTHVTAYLFDPDSDARAVHAKFYQCDERAASEGTTDCMLSGAPFTVLAEVDATRAATDLWVAEYDFTPAPDTLSDKGAVQQRYGFQEIVIVRGDNGLRFIDGFKRVTVKPAQTQLFNKNPILQGFIMQLSGSSLGDDLSNDAVLRRTAYTLVPQFDPGSVETYTIIDFTGQPQTLTEEMSFSWSCSPDCVVSQRISYSNDIVTVTTPKDGAESGRFTVQLVMRDGRGGEAVHVRTFALVPQARVY